METRKLSDEVKLRINDPKQNMYPFVLLFSDSPYSALTEDEMETLYYILEEYFRKKTKNE